jgi:hypothetical protein
MNKAEAKRIAQSGQKSIGELRSIIKSKRGKGGMSNVNPSIPLDRALDIYEAAIDGRPDDERPIGLREDIYRPGRMKPTGDALIIQNILRDAA